MSKSSRSVVFSDSDEFVQAVGGQERNAFQPQRPAVAGPGATGLRQDDFADPTSEVFFTGVFVMICAGHELERQPAAAVSGQVRNEVLAFGELFQHDPAGGPELGLEIVMLEHHIDDVAACIGCGTAAQREMQLIESRGIGAQRTRRGHVHGLWPDYCIRLAAMRQKL
jgi:hypothetical protein